MWVLVQPSRIVVLELLLNRKQDLDDQTNCRISLNENKKTCININGDDETVVKHAVEPVENFLLECLTTDNEKQLLMYYIAMYSPVTYYRRRGEYVYQRDPSVRHNSRLWMHIKKLPGGWDPNRGIGIIVGPNGRGLQEMQGDTSCTIKILKTKPELAIFISGTTLKPVMECSERACNRICWASEKLEKVEKVPKKKRRRPRL
jgi:hypothetical protein